MGNGGDAQVETGLSERGSSGSMMLSSASSNHSSGSISLYTGKGKQGSSGSINLETGVSDHSAGGIDLNVGETHGYRNGGELNIAASSCLCNSFSRLINHSITGEISLTAGLTSSSSMKGGTVRISAGEGSSDQLTDGGDGKKVSTCL